ncbi:MAG: type II secretion system F family protein [bacterium]|nr:type II secretion system F family protein [bacterium]
MPLFEYRAYTQAGKTLSGIIDAQSRKHAHEKLKSKGLFPQEIRADSSIISVSAINSERLSFALMQLASLLKAGIPIIKAIESVVSQVESKDMGRALVRVKSLIEEGKSFASAVEEVNVFPPLLAKMAAAGEAVGNLELILEKYAGFLEKESESAKKIAGAMVYPSVVMTACAVLILFVISYITPVISGIFDSFGKELPFVSRIVVAFGFFIKNNILAIIICLAGGILCFIRLVPKKIKDALKLSMPYAGKAYRMMMYSRWARTLALLHGGGVSLLKALEAARAVIDNEEIEKELAAAERDVEKGKSLSVALCRYFPALITNMVETGQQTGELEKMLNSAAEFYEKEADRRISVFLKMFEPAMIIALGLIVGFIVISVLMPIFEINSLVK